VIKLLITYFQRNHSKEVLSLLIAVALCAFFRTEILSFISAVRIIFFLCVCGKYLRTWGTHSKKLAIQGTRVPLNTEVPIVAPPLTADVPAAGTLTLYLAFSGLPLQKKPFLNHRQTALIPIYTRGGQGGKNQATYILHRASHTIQVPSVFLCVLGRDRREILGFSSNTIF
jgi:hypothetical protein